MENKNLEDQNSPQENPQKEISNQIYETELERELKPKYAPVAAAFISLLTVLFLYHIGGNILTIAVIGLDVQNADMNAIRILTMTGQILFILLPALIFARAVYTNVSKALRIKLPKLEEVLLFVIGLLILMALVQVYLYLQEYLVTQLAKVIPFFETVKNLLDEFDSSISGFYEKLLNPNSFFERILIILVISVTPAICEELFFRGFVQRSFEFKYSLFKSALLTAIFFGIYHFHPYQILPLALLGLFFGYANYKSGSILIPVILHFLNNFAAIVMFFIWGSDDIVEMEASKFENLGLAITVFFGGLILFSLLILLINRYYKNLHLRRSYADLS